MSSSMCQGLQTCLEPRLGEPCVLRLKLAPPKSNFSRSIASAPMPCVTDSDDPPKENSQNEQITTTTTITTNNNKKSDDHDTKSHQNVEMGGWSFLHSLANASDSNNKEAIDNNSNKVYVHPLVKRSSSMLSKKSLEMCTESLGSETGSDGSESSDDISLLSLETGMSCEIKERSKSCDNFVKKRMSRNKSFPPPLTSISGSTGVQVRPHREGGRLVLQAVTISPCNTYFHAERSEGRLRLSLLKDCSPICDNKQVENEEEEEEEEYEEEFGDRNGVEIEAEEKEEEEEEEVYCGEDIEGNSETVGGEIEMGKFPRPSRCKEGSRGNEGLLTWEQFWVAT